MVENTKTSRKGSARNPDTSISVVLPVFNEEKTLSGFMDSLVAVLKSTHKRFEILAVNDGSSDSTADVLAFLENKYKPNLRIIHHLYNKGNGAAARTGILAAKGEIIACMDADGQHDPQDLLEMLPYMDRYDLVVGARPFKGEAQWFRTLANRIYNGLASLLTDFKIEDLTSGYRVFRASAIRKYAPLFPNRFSYPTTSTLVMLKGGYYLKYVPIHIKPRQAGTSKIKLFRDGYRFILIIFKIILLFEPLRVFAPVSIVLVILAILSFIYSSFVRGGLYLPNSSVVLFVLAVVGFMMGLISEQIAAIQISLLENKNKE